MKPCKSFGCSLLYFPGIFDRIQLELSSSNFIYTGNGMNDDKKRISIPGQGDQDAPNYREDEIDFFDIWMVLVRRWRIVLCLLGIALLAGITVAVKKPVTYSYSAAINIGGDGDSTIESMETVRSKLLNVFIPQAIREYPGKDEEKNHVKLDVKIPTDSSLVILKGEGTEKKENLYISLIQNVIEKIMKNHEPRTGVIRKALDVERAIAKRKLQGYEDHAGFLKVELARLDESGKLLKKQIARTTEMLKNLENERRVAIKNLRNEPSAMTILMIDTQTQKTREHLSEMENELFIKTESKRDKHKKDIADNQRQIDDQKDRITKIEGRILGLSETHAVAPPAKSLEPLKSKRLLIIVLSAVLGLFLGALGAFLAEFISKTKLRMHQENQRLPL